MFNECTEIPRSYGKNIHGISRDVATSCILFADQKCKNKCQIGSPITESDSSLQPYRSARAIICYGPNLVPCAPISPPVTKPGYVTSTAYTTVMYTVTSCHPTKTNCHPGHVTTETVSLSTTICPLSDSPATPDIGPITAPTIDEPPTPAVMSYSTSTVYTTTIFTITSCHHTETGCNLGDVTTETISLTTSICPITEPAYAAHHGNTVMPYYPSYWTTSTVYSTTIYTITSCHHSVTGCHLGHVTTDTISLYTTVCPIDSLPTDTDSDSLSSTDVGLLNTPTSPNDDGSPTGTPITTRTPACQPSILLPHIMPNLVEEIWTLAYNTVF